MVARSQDIELANSIYLNQDTNKKVNDNDRIYTYLNELLKVLLGREKQKPFPIEDITLNEGEKYPCTLTIGRNYSIEEIKSALEALVESGIEIVFDTNDMLIINEKAYELIRYYVLAQESKLDENKPAKSIQNTMRNLYHYFDNIGADYTRNLSTFKNAISATGSAEDFLGHLNTLYESTKTFFKKTPRGKLAGGITGLLDYLGITAEQMRNIAERNAIEDKDRLLAKIEFRLAPLAFPHKSIKEFLNLHTVINNSATINIVNR